MAKAMQRKTVSEEVQLEDEVKATEKKVVEKKEFAQSDGVQCHSVVQGGLFYEGTKTGMLYSFSDYGDVTEIEYRDLVAAVRTKSEYVYNPYFIIDDEDFLAEFPAVEKFYEDQISIKDLKNILDMPISDMTSRNGSQLIKDHTHHQKRHLDGGEAVSDAFDRSIKHQ